MQTELSKVIGQAQQWLSHISEAAASHKPTPQTWSAKEVLGHLVDSASVNLERILRVALQDKLELHVYPQDPWVALQAYQARPFAEILELWQALNRHIAHVVAGLPEASLAHTFSVPYAQNVSLKFLIEDYIAHLKHHLRQIGQRTLQLSLREATAADAEAIAGLVRAAWAEKVASNSSGHFFSAEKAAAELGKGHGWLAYDGERLVGTVLLTRHPNPLQNPGVWEIKKMGVIADYRKRGVSQALMQALLHKAHQLRAKELRLAVRSDQPRLLEWYQQFGFVHNPELRYSSPNPQTAPPFVMHKLLEELA